MKKVLVLHPFLFVVFSILFLYVHNISQSTLSDLTLPMGVFHTLTFLVLLLLRLILKDIHKSGIIVTLGLVFFFSYGHLFAIIHEKYSFIRHYQMVPVELLLFVVISYFVLRSHKPLKPVTRFLNITTTILILLSLFNIVSYQLHARKIGLSEIKDKSLSTDLSAAPVTASKPDIYYIILDGYANEMTLKRYYDYDNGDFLDFLRQTGFYLADSSFSNYPYTQFSLASSLNMQYINENVQPVDGKSVGNEVSRRMLRDNRVVDFLRNFGYKFVLIKSGWGPTDKNRYADISLGGVYSEFIKMLVHTSMLRAIEARLFFSQWHRDNINQQFQQLENAHKIPGNKFILCHFVVPHPPFVFGPNGEPLNVPDLSLGQNIWTPRERYMGQLNYTNSMVKDVIGRILKNSPKPPIIILQGDHGSTSVNEWDNPSDVFLFERMMVLNAYFLPRKEYDQLYPTISPVNSFRYVFNIYFDTGHDMVEDVAWYSTRSKPFEFMDVTERVMRVLFSGEINGK